MNLEDGTNVCCPKCCNADVKVEQLSHMDGAKWEEAKWLPQLPEGEDMFLASDPVTRVDCLFCGAVHAWDGRVWQDTRINILRKGGVLQMGTYPPVKHSKTTSTGCKV
jgi:hypothetical protein